MPTGAAVAKAGRISPADALSQELCSGCAYWLPCEILHVHSSTQRQFIFSEINYLAESCKI